MSKRFKSFDGELVVVDTGRNMFIELNGKRIARRYRGMWVSLEPGFVVRDGEKLGRDFIVEKHGVRVH